MRDGVVQLSGLCGRGAVLCIALFLSQRETGVGANSYYKLWGCQYNSSDTGRWTFIYQQVYNSELIVYYDFDLKKHVAVKTWMQGIVNKLNKDGGAEKRYQDGINSCEHNIPISEKWTQPRRVEPEITIRSKVSPSHSGQLALITCHVTGFYPPEIEVKWLKNGAPVPNGAINTVLLSDGDWTYQVEELLQYDPVSGDKYTCHVEHSSLTEPMTMDWEVQMTPESERTKIIVGALGFVVGLLILLTAVIMKLKNARAVPYSSSHGSRLMGPQIS